MESIDELPGGSMEVRLAADPREIDAAQALRFQVFYTAGGAKASPETAASERDRDDFDAVCDHLLVIDHARGETPAECIVGTYRLMRREHAAKIGRFYTAAEYDISRILALPGEILELGRSCTHPDYRTRSTMQMLWQGIAKYVFTHDIAMMFGCASMSGTDPQALALELSYLYHCHLAPEEFRPRALPELYTPMDLLARDAASPKQALAALPPLVKGYLRLGGFVGDGAVVDRQFNTTDVCVMVKTDLVTDKYFRHYDRTARGSSV
ncbi:MAG: GNAT family N-acetyltransferase [Rhodospirillaceae bacterium]